MENILIIDDDKSILSLLEERLLLEGFGVLTAVNGNQGLSLFNDNQVDLVITDIIMQRKDGFITIIDMKSICPDIKIIAMSGGGHAHPKYYLDITKGLGVQYTLKKPFKITALLKAVHKLLEED